MQLQGDDDGGADKFTKEQCEQRMAELITALLQMLVDEERLEALDEYVANLC
jgi:hypothetical protein